MIKYLLFIIFYCFSNLVIAQYVVVDNETKMPLAYVAIKFDKNDGVYSNEDGKFTLQNITGDSISFHALGYEKTIININSIKNDTVYLQPKAVELNEVIVSKRKRKSKIKKYKPEKHNDFIQSHWLFIGAEMATLIPNTSQSDYLQLKTLLIPVVTKTISFDKSMYGKTQIVKKLSFSSMYKIKFYENFAGVPGEQLYNNEITIVLNEKSKVAQVDLEDYNIVIPSTGLFVSVVNLGETDENGKLISSSPFVIKTSKSGKSAKFLKPTKPFFPVYYTEKKNNTYIKNNFETIPEWTIFYKNGKIKKGEYHNVKFGYELKIF